MVGQTISATTTRPQTNPKRQRGSQDLARSVGDGNKDVARSVSEGRTSARVPQNQARGNLFPAPADERGTVPRRRFGRHDIKAKELFEPLGLFLTWGTYGEWLPGDARGWVEYRRGWQFPNPVRELEASAIMTEDACLLSSEQRLAVEQIGRASCRERVSSEV